MKECAICGKEFSQSRSDQLYCSQACRQKAKRLTPSTSDTESISTDPGTIATQKLGDLSKDADFNAYIKMGVQKVSFIPTGFSELDSLTGGGLPRGMISLLYGSEGVGKTSLALALVKGIAKSGGRVLYVDVEQSLNADRLNSLGIPPSQLQVLFESAVEEIEPHVINGIGEYDAIIIDTIAQTVTNRELDQHEKDLFGEANIGKRGLLWNALLRLAPPKLRNTKTAFILINQVRDAFGSTKTYSELTLPGGRSQKFASSLSIKLNKAAKPKPIKGGFPVGHYIDCKIEKSRVCMPFQTAQILLKYEGIHA